MSNAKALDKLSTARAQIAPNQPLSYIASVSDKTCIEALCCTHVSAVLERGLKDAIRILGRECVRKNSPGELTWQRAMAALCKTNSPPTARKYLRLLAEAGNITIAKPTITLVFWNELQPARSDPFWEQRVAHQRGLDAARKRAKRQSVSPKKGKEFSFTPPQGAEIERKNKMSGACITPGANASTKTTSEAAPLTHAAMSLPTIEPVKLDRPTSFVRTRALRDKPVKPMTPEDMAVVEQLASDKPASPADDFRRRAQAIVDRQDKSWQPEDEAPKTPAKPPRQAPPKAPTPKAQRASRLTGTAATMEQLLALQRQHETLAGESINMLALHNAALPYDFARQAFDIALEAGRSSKRGERAPVGNVGGFILGTMRHLARGMRI